jgi:hypothetical protein
MKLLVMLLTFQHLLLFGVLSLCSPSAYGQIPQFNISRQCGGNINQLDTQDSKN